MISRKLLDFAVQNNRNVLLTGKHGVGKTSIIESVFQEHGLRAKYFSVPTMDPWVDFVGIPREVKDEDGEPYLDLVRPRDFRDDEIEAIFLDEINRPSSPKILNAVMELIQFKSINGRKFKNLKLVWGSENPVSSEYHTEKIDAAQHDRFHFHVEVPFKPDPVYFKSTHGDHMAREAIAWWNNLHKDQQQLVSPRRLDEALKVYKEGGKSFIKGPMLPVSTNPQVLINALEAGTPLSTLRKLIDDRDANAIRSFLQDANNMHACRDSIGKNGTMFQGAFHYVSPEEQRNILNTIPEAVGHINRNKMSFMSLITELSQDITVDPKLRSRFKSAIESSVSIFSVKSDITSIPLHRKNTLGITEISKTRAIKNEPTTTERKRVLRGNYDRVSLDMSKDRAMQALILADAFCEKSRNSTVMTVSGHLKFFNTILYSLLIEHKVPIQELQSRAPFLFKFINFRS
jgi:hypothetical protein